MNDTEALRVARKLNGRYARLEISGPPGYRVVRASQEVGPITRNMGRRLHKVDGITEETPMPKRHR